MKHLPSAAMWAVGQALDLVPGSDQAMVALKSVVSEYVFSVRVGLECIPCTSEISE